jgi:hypothetical protein
MTTHWQDQWFSATATSNGGVVRRSRADVDSYSSLEDVITEAKQKGWHVIETGGQVVVLCHQGTLLIHA